MTDTRSNPSPTGKQITGDDVNWWRGAVIYQIYPRSFQDTNGDGVGDLRGITERLDHIAELGVDAIWISPFFASPMKDFGYDVSDYRTVDPMFGSLADFDTMIEKAHRLGIKVMIDQVLSHSSDQHEWFIESRASKDNDKADWYVWADPKPDGTPPNNWLSIFGGTAWQWDARRLQYYLHNFLTTQPDFNFHNLDVQDALLASTRFWLDRGVDGFRLDTINFFVHSAGLEDNPALADDNRNSSIAPSVNPYNYQEHLYDKNQPENLKFLQRFRALLDEYPGAAAVGEVGDAQRSLDIMAAYTSGGDKVHMCYSFEFLSPDFGAAHFRTTVEALEAKLGDGWPCWAFSNHDVERHVSRWLPHAGGNSDALSKVMAAILLSMRGSVCLYQGEELGLPEADIAFEDLVDPYGIEFWPEFKGRDGCRTPMVWQSGQEACGFTKGKPWLPVPQTHVARAADAQALDPRSVLNAYRQFLRFRKGHPVLSDGTIRFLPPPNDGDMLLAFVREDDDAAMLCAFNIGSQPIRWTIPEGMNLTPAEGHGFLGHGDGDAITLGAFDAYFGWIER